MTKCGASHRNQVGCPRNRGDRDALYSRRREFTTAAEMTTPRSAAP
jgi:hypothetical protein